MRKGRFLLLITLILSFIFALGASTAVVFAEEGSDEGSSETLTDAVVEYGDLWTGGTVTRDETKGMSVAVTSGNSASYKYAFETGEGKSFTFSAETTYAESEVKNLFYINVLSDTNSAVVYFDSAKNVRVNTADGESKQLTSFTDVTVSVKDGKIKISGFEFECSLKNPYATVQIYAYYDVTVSFSAINDINFKNEVKVSDSDPVIVAESGILVQEKALVAHTYSVTYKSFNMLSGIKENEMFVKRAGDADSEYIGVSDKDKEGVFAIVASASQIKFCDEGDFVIKIVARTTEGKEAVYTHDITVVDIDGVPDNAVRYEITKEEYEKVKESIADKIEGLAIGDNFYYIDVKDYIVSDFFGSDECNYKVYYANKSHSISSDYTSTSSKYFEISQQGKWVYFVLPTDAVGKGFTYDDDFKEKYELYDEGQEVLGVTCEIGGFYRVDRDDDGEVTAVYELVVPAFVVNIESSYNPEITISVPGENIVIGNEYKVTSITVDSSNTKVTTYKLYYMSESDYNWYKEQTGKTFNKDSFDTDEEYLAEFELLRSDDGKEINGKKIKLIEITDESDEEFDSSNLTFISKRGVYYVYCSVTAEDMGNAQALTYALIADRKSENAKHESEWWKYNWKSVMYLGISVVSAIGIVCLIFIKPKKKNSNDKEI